MPDLFSGKERIKRLHNRLGWIGRVYTDTYQGSDPDTGRDMWNEDETGESAVIRVEGANQPQAIPGTGTGEEHTADAVVIIDPDEVNVTDGNGDFVRASEIFDPSTGTRYRVNRVRDEHSGVVRCDCEIMTE